MRAVEDDVKQMASLGAAAVFGAGAAYASVQAKKKRDSGAVVDLYNAIVDLPDPSALTSDVVDTVGSKYGINMHKDDIDSLVRIYGQYLENLIPTGDTQLRCDRQRREESHAAAAVAAAAAAPAAAIGSSRSSGSINSSTTSGSSGSSGSTTSTTSGSRACELWCCGVTWCKVCP